MAIRQPDVYEHNNPNEPFVDSNFVKGGGRVVADISDLYALSIKSAQLKQYVTKVYVINASATYILKDISNVGNSNGWVQELGASTNVSKNDYSAYSVLAAVNANSPTSIALSVDSILGRIGNVIQAIPIDSDLSSVSTLDDTIPSAKSVVDYVNTSIAGALTFKGGYNVSADTTDKDNTKKLQTSPYPTIAKGDTYVVTVAGTFFGTSLGVADMIIASEASPTTLTGWTLVIKQIPDIVDASESSKGIIKFIKNHLLSKDMKMTLILLLFIFRIYYDSYWAIIFDIYKHFRSENATISFYVIF